MKQPVPTRRVDVDAALRLILEGTAGETGAGFFRALVERLSTAVGTFGAWVAEYRPETQALNALALRLGDRVVNDHCYPTQGTPCADAIAEHRLLRVPDALFDLYPGDPDIAAMGAISYMGVPLRGEDGETLGLMAVVDVRPMPDEPGLEAVFRIFAARAAAELRRLRAEAAVREREAQLSGLVAGALDAIVELDDALHVTAINPAAAKVFACRPRAAVGHDLGRFLADGQRKRLAYLAEELGRRPDGGQYAWLPEGLACRTAAGSPFPAEASLSRFVVHGRVRYTLILRNVNDRLEAERTIRTLAGETAYLKEELRAHHNFDEIIGESPALLAALKGVTQVAETDATVLLTGETGTGKELFARAIHHAGRRAERPLVKVNCAAIPATLIESEFFGHEKGAFTGATQRREGRFALADGGTIFLDEVAELPVDLQAKLLRVLQEGEFEPVGASRPRKVDVRVIAATHRDLLAATRNGTFREDLYYRLNVFPIRIPALRERGADVGRLAQAFATRFARQMGRTLEPLTPDCLARLAAYAWPGNVRELENVIERAVIVARGGRLCLDDAFPAGVLPAPAAPGAGPEPGTGPILTASEMEALERDNLRRALEASGWKVSGPEGAAARLGLKPSTLASRMKALGLARPGRG